MAAGEEGLRFAAHTHAQSSGHARCPDVPGSAGGRRAVLPACPLVTLWSGLSHHLSYGPGDWAPEQLNPGLSARSRCEAGHAAVRQGHLLLGARGENSQHTGDTETLQSKRSWEDHRQTPTPTGEAGGLSSRMEHPATRQPHGTKPRCWTAGGGRTASRVRPAHPHSTAPAGGSL